MRSSLVLICLFLLPSVAFAQADLQKDATALADHGFRIHAAVGYPAIMALGVGWKTAGGTELLLQGGGAALFAFVVGTAEASVSQDVMRRSWGGVYVGGAASLLRAHAFVIDCFDAESCEDVVQTLWLGSPRLGIRLRLDRRKQYGILPYLDLAVGPQFGTCRGDCPGGEFVANAAVTLRALLDFGPRQPR